MPRLEPGIPGTMIRSRSRRCKKGKSRCTHVFPSDSSLRNLHLYRCKHHCTSPYRSDTCHHRKYHHTLLHHPGVPGMQSRRCHNG